MTSDDPAPGCMPHRRSFLHWSNMPRNQSRMMGLVFSECSGWGGWAGRGGTGSAGVGDLLVCERSGDGLSGRHQEGRGYSCRSSALV